MNAQEAAAIVATISFRAGVSMWKPAMLTRHETGGITVLLTISVPDRETGVLSVAQTVRRFSDTELRATLPEMFRQRLFHMYLDFIRHEAMESFLVNGSMVVDPHKSR